ncbi:type I secretion system permease/ATPase [Mesorhizobium sp. BR1-1-16]|uniref:type I secretion system permease/ATPase n=1 Tax=Mesorhizobium sp. BR1-1-16 TaxID=2876653 RepID=UPI001CCB7D1F|nr:type I secretion system permease/ATPase [Mesorhizobium sp. BR1-1-16]MBZ9935232.1 type I secretion system permease/ATPase [Mesorhizobium sp. BR1-1-16]
MTAPVSPGQVNQPSPDDGLMALAGIAAYFHIPADPVALRRELALRSGAKASADDVVRAARLLGLKAAAGAISGAAGVEGLVAPSIVMRRDGSFVVFGGRQASGGFRIIDPVTRTDRLVDVATFLADYEPRAIRIARRFRGAGIRPQSFGFRWFLPSIWRYRRPLGHVLLASLFVQLFALVTPLFFQVVVDKVLTHRSFSTLSVLVVGLVVIGVFDVLLQYLRSYALSHTTNRIDVELGQRLFRHLLHLPIGYFESRSAGQTVARMRELETIRSFLTGQGLFAALDFLFAFVFIAVLFAYSTTLTLIVLGTIPVYLALTLAIRPVLRRRVQQKFDTGALSQQFLVETVVGMETVKASAVEPIMQAEWEDRLAAYVRSSFDASMLGSLGQNAIQYVSKLSTALLLFFGARAVIDGQLSVGQLIAFNMIASQVAQPILRLSQMFQDFQQVQVSIERLGDILNAAPERTPSAHAVPPSIKGAIELRRVSFRYRPGLPEVLKQVSLSIRAGEVVGIVGPSGSGKSTLAKLIQRFHVPDEGQVLIDGMDLTQVDPSWLRRQIGVVLQENLLFNRTIHDNIALANPAMPRAQVIAIARLSGADPFIQRLPEGYDTMIEERGANLSGGQRQRIAIARALATNPPLMIFDEATSALDYESEALIQSNMRQISRGRTVLIVAHRLAAVRHCDRIIGIDDGRIIEQGSHAELLALPGGLYARLWAMQAEGAPT